MRRDVLDGERLGRWMRKSDRHGLFAGLIHLPAVLERARDHPEGAHAVRRVAIDVNRLVGLVPQRSQELVDELWVRVRGIKRQMDVRQPGCLGRGATGIYVGARFGR